MLYYKCPQDRVYRKLNKYRYLSKPDFENWVRYFKPVFTKMNEKPKVTNAEGENEIINVDNDHNNIPKPNQQQQQPATTKAAQSNQVPPQTETQPDNIVEPEVTQANADKKKKEKMFAELATVFDGNM